MKIKKIGQILSLLVSCAAALAVLTLTAFADAVTDELVPVIREGVNERSVSIDISDIVKKNKWSKDDAIYNVGLAYLYCPELFFVDKLYSVYYNSYGEYYIVFDYLMTPDEAFAAKRELDKAAVAAVEGISDDMSDVEKALFVHDYIILNCKYDYDYKGYDSYSCLVKKNAVCQGYSLAYMYILKEYLGIECTIVYSEKMQHAWNYVKIGNKWYHVDLTSDDPSSKYLNVSRDNLGLVTHNNFLISDSLARETSELHRDWQVVGGYPKATSTIYDDAFWRSSTAKVCFDGRVCYYSSQADEKDSNGNVVTEVYRYDFSTGKKKKLLSIKSKWYTRRSSDGSKTIDYGKVSYVANWSKLDMIGDNLFFNTNTKLYRYNIKTNSFKRLYTLDKGTNQIFGLIRSGSNIKIAYRYDLTYAENYVNLIFK